MNRRELIQTLGAGGLTLAASTLTPSPSSAQTPKLPKAASKHDMSGYGIPTGKPQQVAMLIYPQMTALDLVGPAQIFSAMGNIEIHYVWKTHEPIKTDAGLLITPTKTFAECPRDLILLFAPGGTRGTIQCMTDPKVLDFFADRGKRAQYVTSVCTGSLILAAAGLLKGYKATSHWSVCDLLATMGATPVSRRVVTDRNRITGAGVTAGLDFGLQIAAKLRNEKMAKAIQLAFEYDPQPPYQAGTPEGAGEDISGMMMAMSESLRAQVKEAALKAKKRNG